MGTVDELAKVVGTAVNATRCKQIDAVVAPVPAAGKVGHRHQFDNRDTHKPGFKFAEWELKGVPIRLAIGPRDLDNNTIEVARRDTKTKESRSLKGIEAEIPGLLDQIQNDMYAKALKFRQNMITEVESFDDFKRVLDEKTGFVSAHWDGTIETENAIKDATKATIRCIPLDAKREEGVCIYSGKPSQQRVLFARAY